MADYANGHDTPSLKHNAGFQFRHLGATHTNAMIVTESGAGGGVTLSSASKFDDDAASALGGVPVGGFYLLSASNSYGSADGTLKQRAS